MLKAATFASLAIALLCAACTTDSDHGPRAAGADPEVARVVEAEFPDDPLMVRVAECESGLRQYDQNGSVLHGKQHRPDSGVFQINKSAHAKTAKELGLDLDTTQGNAAFALYLRQQYGMAPWASSRKCWSRRRIAHK